MDMYRRNSFRDWWEDVGYIYALVIALVTVIFIFLDFAQIMNSLGGTSASTTQVDRIYSY